MFCAPAVIWSRSSGTTLVAAALNALSVDRNNAAVAASICKRFGFIMSLQYAVRYSETSRRLAAGAVGSCRWGREFGSAACAAQDRCHDFAACIGFMTIA